MKDEDQEDRALLAKALGEIGDERAVEPLIQALKDDFLKVREVAKKALETIQKDK